MPTEQKFDATYVTLDTDMGCGGETPERLEHRLSRGLKGSHSLEGGLCPLCGAWYQYPGWEYYSPSLNTYLMHPNQETDSTYERNHQIFSAPVVPPGQANRLIGRLQRWLRMHESKEK
jgi:hypothetical protein